MYLEPGFNLTTMFLMIREHTDNRVFKSQNEEHTRLLVILENVLPAFK